MYIITIQNKISTYIIFKGKKNINFIDHIKVVS